MDAVAYRGQVESCQRIQKAGRQASETAIPESHVVFLSPERVHVEAELVERRLDVLENTRAIHAVDEKPPHEEFEREVVDPLDIAVVVRGLRGDHPLDDDALHRLRGGDPPVPRRRGLGIARQSELELVENVMVDRQNVWIFGVHDVWSLIRSKIRARADWLRRMVCWC